MLVIPLASYLKIPGANEVCPLPANTDVKTSTQERYVILDGNHRFEVFKKLFVP